VGVSTTSISCWTLHTSGSWQQPLIPSQHLVAVLGLLGKFGVRVIKNLVIQMQLFSVTWGFLFVIPLMLTVYAFFHDPHEDEQ